MIPTATSVQRTNNMGGIEVPLTIDEGSMAFAMSMFTNIYSNPILACVREYANNAADSHIMAGVTEPIVVKTPTISYPYYSVQDFGLGLSQTELLTVCSKYVASTKRTTNDATGMLGIGFKAALAYGPQFSVIAIKDGIRNVVNVGRSEDGAGFMAIVDTAPTDERNGVTVKIPATEPAFLEEATNLFKYWEPGTVLLNGRDPSILVGKKVTDNIYLIDNCDRDVVVMGKVPYPVDSQHTIVADRYKLKSPAIVAYVNIGEVTPTPSREHLLYDDLTLNTLQRIKEEFYGSINDAVDAILNQCSSKSEAFKEYARMKNEYSAIPNLKMKNIWSGERIPHDGSFDSVNYVFVYDATRSRYAVEIVHHIPYSIFVKEGTVFVKNFTGRSLSTSQREKLRIHDSSAKRFVVFDNISIPEWLSHIPVHDWEEIKAISLGTTVRSKPIVKVLNAYREFVKPVDDLAGDIVFFSPSEKKYTDSYYLTRIRNLFPGTIATVPKNQWKRFMVDHPNAKHVEDAIRAGRDALVNEVTSEQAVALNLPDYIVSWYSKIDASKVDDPDILRGIDVVSAYSEPLARKIQAFRYLVDVNLPDSGERKKLRDTADKYDLLRPSHPHFYTYVNAVFKESNEV